MVKSSPLGRANSKILVQLMKNRHQKTGQFKCHNSATAEWVAPANTAWMDKIAKSKISDVGCPEF